MTNTERFLRLELGNAEFERRQNGEDIHLLDESGKAVVGADGKIHVAKRLVNLPGVKMDQRSQEILDEVAAGYDFTPPPMEREMMLRELRARQWEEEDRKQAARLRKEDPMPKWNGVDKDPAVKLRKQGKPVRRSFLSRLKRLFKK